MELDVLTLRRRNYIEVFLQNLARLEREDFPSHNRDLVARLRISSPARALGIHDEVAKPGYLDLLPFFQRALDDLERGLDDIGGIFFRETDLLIDTSDDVCFCHFRPLPFPIPAPQDLSWAPKT